MKKYHCLAIVLFNALTAPLVADPIVSFFFKPDASSAEKTHEQLKNPKHLARHAIHGIVDHIPVSGIYATYSGYITISDQMGEVRFPRKHRENSATIIITPQMEPIPLFGNTIRHWQITPQAPVAVYNLQEMYNPKTQEYSWHASIADIPKDNIIPTSAIVIVAKPKNIHIPLEAVKTLKTANLTLPPVYVKKGMNVMSKGMHTLIIRHLFRPVEQKTKTTTPTEVSSHLLN